MSPNRTGIMKDLPKKIAVLMGGPGSERDVSLDGPRRFESVALIGRRGR